MSEEDNTAKKENGVICHLQTPSEGTVRLVLDDAVASGVSQRLWEVERLFTWRDFDEADFFNTAFSERDLADIGLALVTRLAALAGGKMRG